MTNNNAAAIEMYHYHGQLGLERTDLQFCSVVQDVANPDVWSSNKAYAMRANSVAEIGAMMREVDEVFEGLAYRHFVTDPTTPEVCAAYLALNDYSAYATILQMLLSGSPVAQPQQQPPGETIRPVVGDADWTQLRELVLMDHAEGARTQTSLSEAVTDGIVASYRAKAGPCQFFLVELDGQACAYGAAINSPSTMGMVEDLFTAPEVRGRGLASRLIAHCVEYCRQRGADQILIGSHSSEAPKRLYNKLGFEPAFLTRDLIRQL